MPDAVGLVVPQGRLAVPQLAARWLVTQTCHWPKASTDQARRRAPKVAPRAFIQRLAAKQRRWL